MKILLTTLLFSSMVADAQLAYHFIDTKYSTSAIAAPYKEVVKRKLYQRNTGMIVGLQRGKFSSIELGGEAHWRKISLFKPHIIGATANMEYNFENNILGYKAGVWMKRGRINLTYGANISYYTNFNERQRFGVGPSVGFRFFGLHFINGYNFLTKENTGKAETPLPEIPVNTLYMSIRYYFPVENKFTWDRQTMKKKKARKKARAAQKKERARRDKKKHEETKSKWNIFKTRKHDR